jgi:hypothetical protein
VDTEIAPAATIVSTEERPALRTQITKVTDISDDQQRPASVKPKQWRRGQAAKVHAARVQSQVFARMTFDLLRVQAGIVCQARTRTSPPDVREASYRHFSPYTRSHAGVLLQFLMLQPCVVMRSRAVPVARGNGLVQQRRRYRQTSLARK